MIVAGEVTSFRTGQAGGRNTTHLLKTFSLNNLSLFTKTQGESAQVILDSTTYSMQTNDVVINNSHPELNFNNDRNYFTRVDNKTQLQVWNAAARKKLIQTGFEAEIKALSSAIAVASSTPLAVQ